MRIEVRDFAGRIDGFLAEAITDVSRSFIQRHIEAGKVTLNKKPVTVKSHKVKPGDVITIDYISPAAYHIEPQNLAVEIVYQDEHIAVVNKPSNMVTHPAHGVLTGTLVNAMLYHLKDLSGIGGILRPGIVHRLDKDTSGLLIVAKHDKAHVRFSNMIKKRTVKRQYLAVVEGVISEDEGKIAGPIGNDPKNRLRKAVISGGREATTFFGVEERFNRATLMNLTLQTGRTHQIRVHCAYIKHPVAGDRVYGARYNLINRPALHSHRLRFIDPFSKQEREFTAPLPTDIAALVTTLRHEKI